MATGSAPPLWRGVGLGVDRWCSGTLLLRSDSGHDLVHVAEAVAEGRLAIRSEGLVDECLTFITTDTGAREALAGKHDDRVIAAAIAWQVRQRPWADVWSTLV